MGLRHLGLLPLDQCDPPSHERCLRQFAQKDCATPWGFGRVNARPSCLSIGVQLLGQVHGRIEGVRVANQLAGDSLVGIGHAGRDARPCGGVTGVGREVQTGLVRGEGFVEAFLLEPHLAQTLPGFRQLGEVERVLGVVLDQPGP